MKLIVGLGNPGSKYANTRHNVGFAVAALLAQRCGLSRPRSKFRGEVVEARIGGEQVLLLCPHTYMNRSGLSVLQARDFYQLDDADLLVVCDDFNLPLARLRCRAKGSSGGQKGLGDIIRCLGTDTVSRIRIGIGEPPEGWDVADYVLSRFRTDEVEPMQAALDRAAAAAEDWAREGMAFCMNRYNADPATPD